MAKYKVGAHHEKGLIPRVGTNFWPKIHEVHEFLVFKHQKLVFS